MSSRLRRWLYGFGTLGASCLLVAISLEIVLRVTRLQAEFFFQLDPEVGASYLPRKKGWYRYPDGSQWVEINSLGYRDKEWSEDKPPGTERIVLLGDSYVAAMEVPNQQRFGELLEHRLNEQCGQDGIRYEVLNFAVVGFGTAQQMETLRRRALLFSPDHVLHFFYTGNDLYNNYRPIDVEPNRLHFDLDEQGNLVKLPYIVSDSALKRWLRRHSRSFLFLRDRIKRVRALHRAAMAVGLMQQIEVSKENGVDSEGAGATARLREAQYAVDPPAEIQQAWRVTSALLQETRRLAEQNSATYRLVTVPTRFEIEFARHPAQKQNQRDSDLLAARRRIAEICEEHDFSCLDLTEGFVGAVTSPTESFFPKGGHWNQLGHQVAASALLPWLAKGICAPSGS